MALAKDELRKLVRMLKLGLNHDGTQLLLTCIAAYLAGRQAAKLSLRRKAILDLAQQAAAAAALKIGDQTTIDWDGKVATTPTQVQIIGDTSPSEATSPRNMGRRSASAQTLSVGEQAPSGGMRRVASEQLLASVVKARAPSGALCVDCMSRARSYVEEVAAGGDGSSEPKGKSAKWSPSASRRAMSFASPHASIEEEGTHGAADAHRRDAASPGERVCTSCIVCADATNTWARLMRRVVTACGGAVVSYLLWLRFVAAPETAVRHLMRGVRLLAALFRYRVQNFGTLPREGGALLTVYHGFIPLDMYFLHEWLYRHTGRLPLTLAADFVFRIPWFGWAAKLCGAAPYATTM